MELLIIFGLIFFSVALLAFQFSKQKFIEEVHLPAEIKGRTETERFSIKSILELPSQFIERFMAKGNFPMSKLKARLITAGRPMSISQFLALKILLTVFIFSVYFSILQPKPEFNILFFALGFFSPDLWLRGKIQKRKAAILRELPVVIDLLNICVGAGLDFMVAVNRVIEEFHSCVLIGEFRIMVQEMKMGSSRRDALKNLTNRVDSPELVSFVRILLQADRMGTPVGEVLKMQSEEMRIRRFQRGEEMALKAPIKLLLPLLVFIMPVVLIIVAGPIMIQFTKGGLKF